MSAEAVTSQSQYDGSQSVTPRPICNGCGEGFAPSRKDARYCGQACRQAAWRKRHSAPRPPRKRRPIVDAWRDAVWEYRRAAERIERLVLDERFAPNLTKLVVIGAADMLAATTAAGSYDVAVTAANLPRKFRTAAAFHPESVTGDCDGDGSGR